MYTKFKEDKYKEEYRKLTASLQDWRGTRIRRLLNLYGTLTLKWLNTDQTRTKTHETMQLILYQLDLDHS